MHFPCCPAVLCLSPHISQEPSSREWVEKDGVPGSHLPSSLGRCLLDSNLGFIHLDPNQPEPHIPHLTCFPSASKTSSLPTPSPVYGLLSRAGVPWQLSGPVWITTVLLPRDRTSSYRGDLDLHALASVKRVFRPTVCSTQQPQATLCSAQGQRGKVCVWSGEGIDKPGFEF